MAGHNMWKISLAGILGIGLTFSGSVQASLLSKTLTKSVQNAAGNIPDIASGGGYDPQHAEKIESLVSPKEVMSCLESTCGSPRTNWNYTSIKEDRESLNNELKWVLPTSQVEALAETLRLETSVTRNQVLLVQKLLQSGKKIDISENFRSMMVFFLALADFTEVSGGNSDYISYDGENSTLKVDQEKYAAILQKLPAQKREVVKAVVDAAIISRVDGVSYLDYSNKTMTAYLRKKYPAKFTYAEALKQEATQALATFQMIQKRVGILADSLLSDREVEILQRAATRGLSNKTEEKSCLALFENLSLFGTIFKSEFQTIVNSYPVDFVTLFSDMEKSKFLEKTLADVDGFNPTYEAMFLMGNCREKLQASMPLTASPLRRRTFDKLSEDVRRASQIVAKRMVSPSQARWIDQELAKINFVHEATREERLQDVLNRIVEMRENAEKSLKQMRVGSEELTVVAAAINYLTDKKSIRTKLVEESELKKTCNALPSSVISDSTLPQSGNISVSWFSVNYPEVGLAILAHEFGHIVSHRLRLLPAADSTAFTKTLNCVANRNPFVPAPEPMKAADNTVWSEEDFADHFSAEVMNELRRQGHSMAAQSKNMGCSLIGNKSTEYLASNVLTPTLNDTHSSGVLRLLMMGQDLGTLTPQCGMILNRIQSSFQAPRCQ
ncbi:hypothetical protein [Bdellovibrio sp. HCB2-146]|uniref:hypothetical protein n=1 Tax=Bdellovibrio sp. HCB2-146 TaxID=3394362 RepID=UPI0039BD9312